MPAIINYFLQQRSEPPSLSTWNDIVTIVGVPLGAMLSLIAIMLMIKHHRQARSRLADAELPPIPSQHARILIQDHSKSRVDSCDAWKVSPPVPASTHTDVFSFPPKETPTRGATHDSTTGRTHNMQPRLPQNSSRTSQITLVDEEEYKNPTSIFAYPAAARMNPRRSNISEI